MYYPDSLIQCFPTFYHLPPANAVFQAIVSDDGLSSKGKNKTEYCTNRETQFFRAPLYVLDNF